MTGLVAQILRCPDCQGALDDGLSCRECRRAFAPEDDGIIDALPSAMRHARARKEDIQEAIDRNAPDDRNPGIVMYEQAFHDEQAPHYDGLFGDPLPLRRYYRSLVRDQIYQYVRRVPFVVDLCCGTGKSSAPLIERGITVIGIDVSREMLRIYRRKFPDARNPVLIHADASNPPLRSNSCGALTMIGGLHHIPDRARALQSCCDALAPSGVLILHEPLKTGRTSRLSRLLENVYALMDPVRVWAAIRRRLGMTAGARGNRAEPVDDFTPYERPFRSTKELIDETPRQLQAITVRSQGALSFRQFAPYLQSSWGEPAAALIVRLDQWLAAHTRALSGDALFAVFRKEES